MSTIVNPKQQDDTGHQDPLLSQESPNPNSDKLDFYQQPRGEILESQADFYCHSSEQMYELDDESIALTVTSPPYWNAIDYDVHVNGNGSEWYRTRQYSNGFAGYEEYLDLMERVFTEVLRVTKPGGFCAVVIGTVLSSGKHIPAPFDVSARMVSAGWDFHQDIIWHKTTAGVRRAGVIIQKPYPGYYYPNIMTEYILVFRKDGEPIYRQKNGQRESSKIEIDDIFKLDVANNVWHIAPVPPGQLDHPCPFPAEIPYRLIRMYSYRGDIILDPFVGAGQTTSVAVALGRGAVGYDIEEKYVEYSRKRIGDLPWLRPMQLVARFDKRPMKTRFG